ncbi:MAG: DNA methylase [Firmicutes bacterium]|nr:DNA methylase [Bacillota bacterium]
MEGRRYIAIDLKSFYASVECVERGLDPLDTMLVVADESRTEKTICLAVSPALKAHGIAGRARLFEANARVREVNALRRARAPGHEFAGKSYLASALADPSLALDFLIAPPQMAHYMEVSTQIYNIYLQFIAPEDIHVYSIDEVLIDATPYLKTYGLTARELAQKLIREVLRATGVTATAGIGTNLYLCKVAMDIVAKHIPADENGVRIAELDELEYRRRLWSHTPLTDFWRVGPGYARQLEKVGLKTMGDIARCSVGAPGEYYSEELLYRLFGVNAELLIDHAWGWESCTIAAIKAYRPEENSLSSGQVLSQPYSFEKGRLIVREMTDLLALELVDKALTTDQLVLSIGYDTENLSDAARRAAYRGTVVTDRYGRSVPKGAHGSIRLGRRSSSTKELLAAITTLYNQITDENLLVRRLNVSATHLLPEGQPGEDAPEQLSLFSDSEVEKAARLREKNRQKAILQIQKRFGKNALLKGMNFEEGATTRERNGQVGGHKA